MNRLENIRRLFKSTTSQIKTYLRSQEWRQVLIFLFFVLLSFGFWVSQNLEDEYERTIYIPVSYRNMPPDIITTVQPPQKITVTVRDQFGVLMNYAFGRVFAPIVVNMGNTAQNSNSIHILSGDIQSEISKQLISSTKIVSFEPQQIDVFYSQRAHKPVPAEFAGNIQTKPGFSLSGPITISPSNVEVYAAKEVVDTLTSIPTIFTEIKNVDKTITKIVKIVQDSIWLTEPEVVTITIPVEEFTEKTFEIPVTFANVPYNINVRAFPSIIKVNVHIPLSRYRDLTEQEFAIVVDYNQIEDEIDGEIPIELTVKPEWIKNTMIYPDQIEFIFEQR